MRHIYAIILTAGHASPGWTGTYFIAFLARAFNNIPPINLTVHVTKCGVGDVTVSSGDTCQTCGQGYFSFNPTNSTCDICVPDAECEKSTVLPVAGFWTSSPRSTQMHR
jgi:hypothetical protein